MTRSELLTAIKAYRDQGYELQVKLNTTNDALQAEYSRLQAAWKSHNVDTVENSAPVAEISELAPVAEVSLSNFEGIDYETMRYTNWVSATPLTCDVNNFQYCELAPVESVFELPTQRNIAAEVVAEAKATDTYWLTWNAAYYRAVDTLASKRYQGELTTYQDKWNTMMNSKVASTPKPVDYGVILAFVVLQSWQVFTSLVVPVLGQTFAVIRNTLINQTLAFKGFKTAAKFAKKTAIA